MPSRHRRLADDQAAFVVPAKRRIGEDHDVPGLHVFEQQPTRGGLPVPKSALTEDVALSATLTSEEVAARVGAANRTRDIDRIGAADRPERRFLPAQFGSYFGQERPADGLSALGEKIHKCKIAPWKRRTEGVLLLATFFAAACDGGPPRVGPPPVMPAEAARLSTSEAVVEPLAEGLEVVWGLAVSPDGRVFVSERPGRIRVIAADGGLRASPWAVIDVWAHGEAGLLGLTLHPAFPDSPYVYVVYSYLDAEAGAVDRVSRLREQDGRGVDERVILSGIPAGARHAGGALAFGPDGKLYVGTGDTTEPRLAQDLSSLGGKILRINPDGSVPADNPFPGSPVYALGLRNVQGFDWEPRSGRLYATEHGPSGEWARFGRDEVNIIVPGANYGWPKVLGTSEVPDYTDPWLEYRDAVAPAAAAFYDGPILAWRGDLFFGTLRGEHLHRVSLAADGKTANSLERLWPDVYGRIRAVARGPDGHLYFGTSNRDGRGHARPGDDHVYRVVPRSTGED